MMQCGFAAKARQTDSYKPLLASAMELALQGVVSLDEVMALAEGDSFPPTTDSAVRNIQCQLINIKAGTRKVNKYSGHSGRANRGASG